MEGDAKGGFTIFFGDDGLDTGDILMIKETDIDPDDTVGLAPRSVAKSFCAILILLANDRLTLSIRDFCFPWE